MNRRDLLELEKEETLEGKIYIEYDNVHSFINEIENKLNEWLKDLDSINCIGDLHKIESVRDHIKSLSDDLY